MTHITNMADSSRQKRKKKNNVVTDLLVYIALRILVIFIYLFDVETNLKTACLLGRLLWKYYHRGRERALDNLRELPGKRRTMAPADRPAKF